MQDSGRRHGWLIVTVLAATLGLHNGSRIGPASLIDELRVRFEVDYGGVGNLIGAYTLTYAFAQLSAGFLTDRFGSRRLLLTGLGLMAVGSATFALAPSYSVALLGRWTMGIAGGCLYTPAVALCFAAFQRSARGRAMAYAQSGTGAGLVLSISVLPVLYEVVGLTGAFLVYPVLAGVLWLAVWRFLPGPVAERHNSRAGLSGLIRSRDFWLLLIGFAFIGMLAQSAVLSWVATYLRSTYGWTAVEAGFAGGLVAAGLMVFPAPFGMLADRIGNRRRIMLVGCGLGLAGWTTLLAATDPRVAIGGALLVSASMAATIPMQAVYASERFSNVGSGTAVGLVNTGAQIAQALAAPLYGALLDQGFGFAAIWTTTVLLGVVRSGAVLLLGEPRLTPQRDETVRPSAVDPATR
ncbi:MAG TPA: MFS transporter [Chloroflexota bacterium]|nr:MFS transporter [Chloroflexota bacterium]